jgi:sugar-specific transcriptional regulator TrmB
MIINEDFLNRLRRSFGLNLYEVKLWAAILSRGVSTAGELSDIADVPRSRTYDVLESLERKGFVIVKPEKPIKYMAIPPPEVLDRVHGKIRAELINNSERIIKLKDSEMMAELGNLHKQGIEPMQVTDFSGALKGRHNIYDQISYILKEARSSVDLVTSEEGLSRKIRMLKPLIERAVSRGVKIRVVAPSSNVELTEIMNSFGELVEFRNDTTLRGRFCIVDKIHVVFMLTDDEEVHPSYDMGFWVKSPYFAGTLNKMFDKTWGPELSPDTE